MAVAGEIRPRKQDDSFGELDELTRLHGSTDRAPVESGFAQPARVRRTERPGGQVRPNSVDGGRDLRVQAVLLSPAGDPALHRPERGADDKVDEPAVGKAECLTGRFERQAGLQRASGLVFSYELPEAVAALGPEGRIGEPVLCHRLLRDLAACGHELAALHHSVLAEEEGGIGNVTCVGEAASPLRRASPARELRRHHVEYAHADDAAVAVPDQRPVADVQGQRTSEPEPQSVRAQQPDRGWHPRRSDVHVKGTRHVLGLAAAEPDVDHVRRRPAPWGHEGHAPVDDLAVQPPQVERDPGDRGNRRGLSFE